MDNSNLESDLLQFSPFHPANTNDSHISFDLMKTDFCKPSEEKIMLVTVDYHVDDDGTTDVTDIYLEEAQTRQLYKLLKKHFGEEDD